MVLFFHLWCQLGYDNTTGEWDEYPSYVNAEGLEIGSPVSIFSPLASFQMFLL